MMKMENPAAPLGANRVLNIKALAGVDAQNPTEFTPVVQSEMLALHAVMRRFRVTIHHARVICQLSGLGGRHT